MGGGQRQTWPPSLANEMSLQINEDIQRLLFHFPSSPLEETVVPHPNQKHTEKKFWNV